MVLDETTPQLPLNAYGASKRAIEDMLRDFGAAVAALLVPLAISGTDAVPILGAIDVVFGECDR